jgi:predicted transcriptional regulator
MAITSKQFEEGLDVNKTKILDFLQSNSDKAYNYEEIAENVGLPNGVKSLYFRAMLNALGYAGLIEKKVIKVQSYFRAAQGTA